MFVKPQTPIVHVTSSASKMAVSNGEHKLSDPKIPSSAPRLAPHDYRLVLDDGSCDSPTASSKDDASSENKTTQLKPEGSGVVADRPMLRLGNRLARSIGIRSGTIVKAELGTYIALPLSAAGFINATIAVNTLSSVTEFASWAALFREFFVKSMTVHYYPQSRYQGPIGFVNTTLTQAAGQPFLVLPVHHGVTAPSSVSAAAENLEAKHVSTFDPWSFSWKNIEKSSQGTVISPVTGTATPTQGWCLSDSTSSSAYTGALLFLSQSATGSVSSAVVGQFLVKYEVLFRYRE